MTIINSADIKDRYNTINIPVKVETRQEPKRIIPLKVEKLPDPEPKTISIPLIDLR